MSITVRPPQGAGLVPVLLDTLSTATIVAHVQVLCFTNLLLLVTSLKIKKKQTKEQAKTAVVYVVFTYCLISDSGTLVVDSLSTQTLYKDLNIAHFKHKPNTKSDTDQST